jgi:LAO/AO transport system kinase
MEIADIFVVNTADRPGADRIRTDIELMLGMRAGEALRNVPAHHGVDLKKVMNPARIAREAAAQDQTESWTPPVLRTIAQKGEGIGDLITALDRHVRYLETSGELRRRRRQRLREQVIDVTEHKIRQRLWRDDATNAFIDAALPGLESGAATPFTVANDLLSRSGQLLTRT